MNKEINFDEQLFSKIKNIIENCVSYINGKTDKINNIYIYISFEWNVFYNVFYESFDNNFYKKHRINTIINGIDTSPENQSVLNKKNNHILEEIKNLFSKDNREIPTQIKIKYSPKTGKNKIRFNYKKFHNDELLIGDDALAEKWFEEIQSGEKRF